MTDNPRFIMMVGAPGSGKSTWINKFVSDNIHEWVIISTDIIIEAYAEKKGLIYSEAYKEISAKDVRIKFNIQLRQSLNKGLNIVLDQTNMTIKSRRKKLSQIPKEYEITATVFELDRSELRKRAIKRKNETKKEVSEKVIDDMIERYERPTKNEGFNSVRIITK